MVFVDGSKNESGNQRVSETQRVALAHEGDKFSVFLSRMNKGLESSILTGVSAAFETSDAVIVLEDDLSLMSMPCNILSIVCGNLHPQRK